MAVGGTPSGGRFQQAPGKGNPLADPQAGGAGQAALAKSGLEGLLGGLNAQPGQQAGGLGLPGLPGNPEALLGKGLSQPAGLGAGTPAGPGELGGAGGPGAGEAGQEFGQEKEDEYKSPVTAMLKQVHGQLAKIGKGLPGFSKAPSSLKEGQQQPPGAPPGAPSGLPQGGP